MMAKPMKTLEMHNPMIQFLRTSDIQRKLKQFKPITEAANFKIGEFLVYFQRLIHKSEDRSRDALPDTLGFEDLYSKVNTLFAKPRTLKHIN